MWLKKTQYLCEGFGFWLVCRLFEALGPRKASSFGSLLGYLGPFFPVNKVAFKNISTVLPKLTPEEKKCILKKMWQEWGRVAGEYCHMPFFKQNAQCITIKGQEHIKPFIEKKQPMIFVTGHLSNFQMITLAAQRLGISLSQFYRHANNPYVDKGMYFYQTQAVSHVLTKGKSGTLQMARTLKEGKSLFVLIDQKFNEGPLIPFLGHPCHTSTSMAYFAKKFGYPFVPVFVTRSSEDPLKFTVQFEEPLSLAQDDLSIMQDFHDLLAKYILKNPHQWFFVHKRWPFSSLT